MIEGQLDTVDIQARVSTEYIIRNVEKGLDSVLNVIKKTHQERENLRNLYIFARDLLQNWDFRFNYEQIQPSIYLAFEYNFATFF
jgi:hypothetical protein